MDERQRGQRRTGITVIGSGSASAAVDEVTVVLGIVVIRVDAGQAFQVAAQTATRVLAILADDGADSRSVRTADLSLGPRIEWQDNHEVLIGYQAGQRLVVHLSGLAGLEQMLSDIATQGGEGVRIEEVTLTPSDPGAALATARAAAYADALAKATQLAELAGRPLGELSWIDENRDNLWRTQSQPLGAQSRTAVGLAKMPVATGDTEVGSTITAHWQFAG